MISEGISFMIWFFVFCTGVGVSDWEMNSDERLLRRIIKGEDIAIEEFVRKYYPVILAYCKKRLRDRNLAEDVTQETFEHFFRRLSLYRHQGKIKNYLFTIAGNLCRDLCKKKTEMPMEEADLVLSRTASKTEDLSFLSYDPMDGIPDQIDIKNAMDKLPEPYREIVILHFFGNLKQQEIAELLDLKLHVVKYRIKKGKLLLKEILGEEGLA